MSWGSTPSKEMRSSRIILATKRAKRVKRHVSWGTSLYWKFTFSRYILWAADPGFPVECVRSWCVMFRKICISKWKNQDPLGRPCWFCPSGSGTVNMVNHLGYYPYPSGQWKWRFGHSLKNYRIFYGLWLAAWICDGDIIVRKLINLLENCAGILLGLVSVNAHCIFM